MTFLELANKLMQRTATGGSDLTAVTGLTGAQRRLVNYVIEAWTDIQSARRDWGFRWAEFSVTLASGSQVYNLRTAINAGEVKLGTYFTIEKQTDSTTRRRISLLDYNYFEDVFGGRPAQSGSPLYATLQPDGQNIKFDVSLDVNYVLKGKYQRVVQVLAATTDTPTGLPAEYHDAIFYLALMKWAEFEEAGDIYITAKRAYDEWMQRLVNDFLPKVLVGQDGLAGSWQSRSTASF